MGHTISKAWSAEQATLYTNDRNVMQGAVRYSNRGIYGRCGRAMLVKKSIVQKLCCLSEKQELVHCYGHRSTQIVKYTSR